MRKIVIAVALASVTGIAPMMPAPAFAQAAQPAHYSVAATLVGKLIDDLLGHANLRKRVALELVGINDSVGVGVEHHVYDG